MKKLGILFVVLLILTAGYFLLRWYSQPDEFVPPADFKISEWTQENINEIRLVFEGDKQVVIKEDEGKWRVNDFPADSKRITDFFNSLKETGISSRVSSNSQNHSRFEVDDKGTDLTFVSNDQIVQQLIVGKTAGGNSAYVRLPEQDDVYVINNFPIHLLSEEVSFWRDREVVAAEPSEVRMVAYQSGGSTWKVNKIEDGWTIQLNSYSPVAVDSVKVESWLTSVVGLQASGFPEEGSELSLKVGTVTIETGTVEEFSTKEELFIHSSDEEGQIVVVNGDLQFLAIEDTINSIYQTYSELAERFKIEEKLEESPGDEV